MWLGLCVLFALALASNAAPTSDSENSEPLVTMVEHSPPQQLLPDTSAITGELIEKLGVTKFFSLWLVFNHPSEIDIQTGTDFTILAPKQPVPLKHEDDDVMALLERPAAVKRVLLDHVLLGRRLRLATRADIQPFSVTTLGGRQVNITHRDGSWYANGARVLEPESEISESGEVVVLDHYLFSDYEKPATPEETSTPAVTVVEESAPLVSTVERVPEEDTVVDPEVPVSVDDPVKMAPASEEPVEKHVDTEPSSETVTEDSSEQFADLAEELSKLPAVFNLTRVPVFNKFLKDAGVSPLLEKGKQYTVLFPMDRAFQRWHPIDWGFYPFSVPEFTAEVIRSHFLKGALRYEQIADNFTAETINNRVINFRRTLSGDLTANGVPVMRRDVVLRGGTVLVVPEVLFVNHKVVQELRKHHKDKESPPLLAYPWWNAQFLSHAYIAIEKNANLTSMERLMNAASQLHLQVPGKNYSFLVPTDEAFIRAGLTVPAWWSERNAGDQLSPESVQAVERLLLRHLLHGRLYMRQLAPELPLHALDNSTHTVAREDGEVLIDEKSKVLEGDVFVYNLGTMFFVDTVLGTPEQLDAVRKALATPQPTTPGLAEESELEEESGTGKDSLVDESSNSTQSSSSSPTPEVASTTPVTTQTEVTSKSNQESNDIPPVEAQTP